MISLIVVTMLFIRSTEFIHLITEGVCPLTSVSLYCPLRNFFYFCKFCSYVPLFISDFCYLIVIFVILISSPFFLVSLTQRLSLLLIFSKNQLWVLLIFSLFFLSFGTFISALVFIVSFLILALGLMNSFFPLVS